MNNSTLEATPLSVFLTFILVILTIAISYKEKLKIEKEILVAALRASVQLLIVGYVLKEIFELDNIFFTSIMVMVIIFNAAFNSKQRGKSFSYNFLIPLLTLSLVTIGTLSILIAVKALKFDPTQVVPLAGVVAGNSMTAINLVYSSLEELYEDNKEKVIEKLALGATPKQASKDIVKSAIGSGLIPTIDKARALGLVTFPGTMNGLLFAGVSPLIAISYQLMIIFTQISTATLSSYIVVTLTNRTLYTNRAELINLGEKRDPNDD